MRAKKSLQIIAIQYSRKYDPNQVFIVLEFLFIDKHLVL